LYVPFLALCTDWESAASLTAALWPGLEDTGVEVEEDPPPEDVVVVELPETEGVPEGLELQAPRRRPVAAATAVIATSRRANPVWDSETVDMGSPRFWSLMESSECRLLQGAAAKDRDAKKLHGHLSANGHRELKPLRPRIPTPGRSPGVLSVRPWGGTGRGVKNGELR
jgi:hypothetical protein